MSMLAPDVQSTVSRTKPSFRDEVDINKIVARARQGQAVTHVGRGTPAFMDVSEVSDYKGALDMIRNADAFFQRLPAKVRAEFGNDPALFLDEVDTTEGRARFERAGLLPKIRPIVPVPSDSTVDAANPAGNPRRGDDGRFIPDVFPRGGTS